MDELLMKYFVLSPTKDDDYGHASMNAISEYAFCIREVNPQLSKELNEWMESIITKRRKDT